MMWRRALLFWCLFSVQTSLKAERLIITVAAPDIPPFVYQDSNGHIKGSLIEQMQRFEQYRDFSFKFYIIPWARALKAVSDGKINAIMPTLITLERQQFLHYPQLPLHLFSGDVLLQRTNTLIKVSSIDEIPLQASVAKMRATALGEVTEDQLHSKNIQWVDTVDVSSAIDLLTKGRVDYVIADSKISTDLLERLELLPLIAITPLSSHAEQTPSYLAFSKKFAAQYDINVIMQQIMLPPERETTP